MPRAARRRARPGLLLDAVRGLVLALDVNVLVYAHRRESPDHERYAAWLRGIAQQPEPFGLPESVCTGFVRIVTNARLWRPATEPVVALDFIRRLRARRGCRLLLPSSATFEIFERLVTAVDARGKLVADAALAAFAIEHGCTLATCDGDFARFPEVRWEHPLAKGGRAGGERSSGGRRAQILPHGEARRERGR